MARAHSDVDATDSEVGGRGDAGIDGTGGQWRVSPTIDTLVLGGLTAVAAMALVLLL